MSSKMIIRWPHDSFITESNLSVKEAVDLVETALKSKKGLTIKDVNGRNAMVLSHYMIKTAQISIQEI